MMRPGLSELKAFYASPDGQRTASLLAAIAGPALHRQSTARLLAVGYAPPLLAGFDRARIERLAIVMPVEQGAEAWPGGAYPGCTLAANETELPFAAAMFDQALLVHALEFCDARKLLRELWRVLAPAGELVIVVPNRAGLWTHFETTPFGQGHPFGRGTLSGLLRDAMFEPVSWKTALVAPPVRGIRWLDRPLTRLLPGLGGIHFVLARKTDGLKPAFVGRALTGQPAKTAPAYSPASALRRHHR